MTSEVQAWVLAQHFEGIKYMNAFINYLFPFAVPKLSSDRSSNDATSILPHLRLKNLRNANDILTQPVPFNYVLCVELIIMFLVLNTIYKIFICQPTIEAVFMLLSGKQGKSSRLGLKGKVVKCAQANMEFMLYTVLEILGIIMICSQSWFWVDSDILKEAKGVDAEEMRKFIANNDPCSAFGLGFSCQWFGKSMLWWTNQPDNEVLSPELVFFYVLYAARYAERFISVFLEPKRKDFLEMQIHHITTFILVILSFQSGYVKIGLVIMVLMDCADPFLHLAKQFIYCRDVSKAKYTFLSGIFGNFADAVFVLFLLSFSITRMVMYPYVVYSAFADNYYLIIDPTGKTHLNPITLWNEVTNTERATLVFLVILLVLQVFWFALLMKVLYKVISGENVDDDRSDDEGGEAKTEKIE